jgi:hypothetical protein
MTENIFELLATALEPQLRSFIDKLVTERLEHVEKLHASRPTTLSAGQVSRRVKCRPVKVLQALRSGALKGNFLPGGHGGRGEWKIDIAEADRWCRLHFRLPPSLNI